MAQLPVPIDPTGSVTYSVNSTHELNWPGCDGYGVIILTHFDFAAGTATGNYGYSSQDAGACYYKLYCTNGNASASCPNDPMVQPRDFGQLCETYFDLQTHDVWISIDGGKTKYCSPLGTITTSVAPVPCS